MELYFNIGKSVLIQALGVQKNYVETIDYYDTEIDEEATGCYTCKTYALKQVLDKADPLYPACSAACEFCKNKCFHQVPRYKKVYHNEKNKYGSYLPTLKSNSIKLLLLYHSLHPDKNGFIKDIDLFEISELLNCDYKTVLNNNHLLKQYGYIYYSETSKHHISLLLPEYESYYFSAKQGGRGFLTMSKDSLMEILNIQNLVSLKVYLRQLLELDELTKKGQETVKKSYGEIRNYLPGYCKRNVIQKAISKQNTKLFSITLSNKIVIFTINAEYNAKKVKENSLKEHEMKLIEFCKAFNADVATFNTTKHFSNLYPSFIKEGMEKAKSIAFDKNQIEDLAALCIQYNFELVINALSQVYHTYYMNNKKPHNIGGLIRTIILKNLESKVA